MKNDKVFSLINKLTDNARNNLSKQKYECVLANLSAACQIAYYYNQYYVNEAIEGLLYEVGKRVTNVSDDKFKVDDNVVLYYDGLGFDTRGLALMYLNALKRYNYKIVYVTDIRSKDKQPKIHHDMATANIEFVYLDMCDTYLGWAEALSSLFRKYQPAHAFFYSTPYDVVGAMIFRMYDGLTKRYQIDLTDHAFWIGKYSFDLCVELRDVGSKVSCNNRKISKSKMVMLPYYAYFDDSQDFLGLPFDLSQHRLIFSGGSLFKTLGDPENKYYKIVDYILAHYDDTVFLYSGHGDRSEFEKLIKKYEGRILVTEERKDFYQMIKRCTFYLNTYPMFGGMMMNYSATAGKIPLTLKHNHDADGLLFNQSKLGIEFDTLEEVLEEIDLLLTDDSYLKNKEKSITNSVITREKFELQFKKLLDTGTTDYELYSEPIEVTDFQREFALRFNYKKSVSNSIVKRINRCILFHYPVLIIYKLYYKLRGEL